MARPLTRIIKSGWTNFTRNNYLSAAATGIIALTLIVFLGLISLRFLTGKVVATLEDKIDISAYFKAEATEDQILEIKSDLSSLAYVKEVEYISKEKALELFKARHAGDELISDSLEQLDFNPLTASLNIKAEESSNYAGVAQFLNANKLAAVIDRVSYDENKDVIDRIENLSRTMSNWGVLATILLAAIGVMVMFNTIRLTIYNQKQEIEIMRLVGASNWFIRTPYIIEGGFYGLFGSLIASVIFYPLAYFTSQKVASFAPEVNIFNYFVNNIYIILPLAVAFGVILGMLSSFIAIRKHLKI